MFLEEKISILKYFFKGSCDTEDWTSQELFHYLYYIITLLVNVW